MHVFTTTTRPLCLPSEVKVMEWVPSMRLPDHPLSEMRLVKGDASTWTQGTGLALLGVVCPVGLP
jgi:hypothetical protein